MVKYKWLLQRSTQSAPPSEHSPTPRVAPSSRVSPAVRPPLTELAAPFEMTLPAVSKHLKVLERAGLIARGREAQWRPCRLDARPLKDASEWVERYRQNWEESFDRLDNYLRELQEKEKKYGRKITQKEEKNGRNDSPHPQDHHALRPGDRDDPRLPRARRPRVRSLDEVRAPEALVWPAQLVAARMRDRPSRSAANGDT